MIQLSSTRPARASRMLRLVSLLSACGASLLATATASAAPLAYPQAVTNSEVAAKAVLARAGRETCLRGKLTRALLSLSDSCAAAHQDGPLCALADRAVVVTPMSRPFMSDTARQILALSDAPPTQPTP